MSTAAVQKKNTIYYVNSIIVLFFMFGFGYIPPFAEQITPYGMQGIGVLLGLFYGWSFVEMVWPSLMSFGAFAYWGHDTLNSLIANGFGSNLFVVVMALSVLAYYLEDCGLIRWIAQWFVTRKIAYGRPYVLLFLVTFSSLILTGVLTTPYPVIVICWGICYEIADIAGFERRTKQSAAYIAGVVAATAYGCMFFPWSIAALFYSNCLVGAIGEGVPFVQQFVIYPVYGVLFTILWTLTVKYVFRIDYSSLAANKGAIMKLEKLNKAQRNGLILMVVFAAIVTYANLAPANWPLAKVAANLNVLGITFVVLALLGILRNKETGDALHDIGAFFQKGSLWAILLMLAATMPMASALESDDAGIMDFIVDSVLPIVSGLSPLMALLVLLTVFFVLTQFVHNFVLGAIFIPLFAPIVVELGIEPTAFTMGMCMVLCSAFISPACSGNIAMIYGNPDWVTSGQAYKFMTCSAFWGYILTMLFTTILYVLF